jgi:undecaprenyl-diphosphatase
VDALCPLGPDLSGMSHWMLTLGSYDERLLLALVMRRRRIADVAMRAITRLADPEVAITLTLALAWGPVASLRPAGRVAAFALTVSHLVVQLLKRTVVRPRPALPVGLSFLLEPQDRFSFPSGHAAAGLSVALPLFLALAGPWAFCVLGLGLLVGVSRCYLGVHYPGDVLVGWTLAALSVAAAGPVLDVAL